MGAFCFGGYAQRDWWDVTGNDVDPRLHFFGATNCAPLIFKTNNNERMWLLLSKNHNPIPQAIAPDVFYEVNISACTLKVPIASVSAYQKAEVWKEFNIVGIEVGITEPDPKSGSGDQLVLYPNPSTGTCSITIPEEFLFESSLTLSIYDNSGKLLQQIPIENGAESFNVQLEHRAAGVYPVVLSNGRKSYRGKIVFK